MLRVPAQERGSKLTQQTLRHWAINHAKLGYIVRTKRVDRDCVDPNPHQVACTDERHRDLGADVRREFFEAGRLGVKR